MPYAMQESHNKAKTFSRSKVIETIRGQYRQMKIHQRVMDECIEKLKETGNEDYYTRTLVESMAQYRLSQTYIETWCDSFGITKGEIDPAATA